MWIGVAIGIPDPYDATLTRARIDAQDPKALLIPPHITLLPPTRVRPDDLDRVRDHLEAVARAHSPFVVRLAGTQTFRPVSPVVFVPLTHGESGCASLQEAVNVEPTYQKLRFPYHPHVTIAHELPDAQLDRAEAAMADFTAEFPVATIELYQHGEDAMWREMASFPLRA